MERRITTSPRENKLKAVAGLIQKLSYREMQKLAKLLAPSGGADELAEKMLDIAEFLVSEPEQ